MILAVLRGNKIAKLSISDVVEGNYIVKDYKTNVIGVLYADNGRWIFNPNKGYIIEGLATGQGCYVDENQEIIITKAKNQERVYLYLYTEQYKDENNHWFRKILDIIHRHWSRLGLNDDVD